MGAISVRGARAVFYYGIHCEGSPASTNAVTQPSVRERDMHGMVAALEAWKKLSEETRTAYRQWTQCGNVQDGERLRAQLARDLSAWAKAKVAKS